MRSNALQKQNPHPLEFDFKEVPFKFSGYKKEIEAINPDVVILFLHLKDFILWPLMHWLKFNKIPIAYWNKAIILMIRPINQADCCFDIYTRFADGLILYSRTGD